MAYICIQNYIWHLFIHYFVSTGKWFWFPAHPVYKGWSLYVTANFFSIITKIMVQYCIPSEGCNDKLWPAESDNNYLACMAKGEYRNFRAKKSHKQKENGSVRRALWIKRNILCVSGNPMELGYHVPVLIMWVYLSIMSVTYWLSYLLMLIGGDVTFYLKWKTKLLWLWRERCPMLQS